MLQDIWRNTNCTKMSNLYCLLLLVLIVAGHYVESYSVEDNFDYINKVLVLLNDDAVCQLPTYEGIDELQQSFRELEEVYGESLEEKLNADQKLVRRTLLDQWDSFQARMTSAVVIRFSKKRSFMCKVESYQKAKYGHSVCTSLKDSRSPETDKIFEKNPIVRYIKHLDNGDVPEPEPEQEQEQEPEAEPEKEKEVEVIHTPISDEIIAPEVETLQSHNSTREETNEEEKKDEDTYDPLVDIPVPPAEETIEEQSVEVITTTTTSTTTELPEEEPDSSSEETVSVSTPPVETTTEAAAVGVYKMGVEYVDDESDDEDLNRLNKVMPVEWHIDPMYANFRWPDENPGQEIPEFDDQSKAEWRDFLNDPEAEETPEVVEPETEEPVFPVTTTETPEYVPRRLSAKELRRKRKELLDKISGERNAREQDQLFGWSNAPERERETQEAPKDRWVKVADNNMYKINYNRDYLGKTRPVKAVKSLFGKGNSKKALMSRN